MFSKKKKFIILGVMAALLITTGVLNLVLNNNVVDTGAGQQTTANFFATYRSDRQTSREQQIVYLDAIINSTVSTEAQIAAANVSKLNIVNNMNLELACEGLIKSKGFEDAIVSYSSSMYNIVVKSAVLNSTEVAQIVAVLQEQVPGLDIDYIKIIPVE